MKVTTIFYFISGVGFALVGSSIIPVSGVSSAVVGGIILLVGANMGGLPRVQELEETSKCLEIMTPPIVNVPFPPRSSSVYSSSNNAMVKHLSDPS